MVSPSIAGTAHRFNSYDERCRDVTQDEEALAKLERMDAVGTPVTVVDGEEVIFGFDRKKLQETLGL